MIICDGLQAGSTIRQMAYERKEGNKLYLADNLYKLLLEKALL